jgi:hypothetical protein
MLPKGKSLPVKKRRASAALHRLAEVDAAGGDAVPQTSRTSRSYCVN